MLKSIAVLMSTYNGEKYIAEQLDSILNQKLENITLHVFIRDDGSTDSTPSILSDYCEKDKRITVIIDKNIGYIASFLKLLENMKELDEKYQYYALSDQDDIWDSDKLQNAINCIQKLNSDKPILYQATTRVVDENGSFRRIDQTCSRPITFYNTAIQTFSAGHTYVFNIGLLNQIPERVDASYLYGHDALLTNIAAIMGEVIFDNIPHNDYRQHSNNQIGTSQSGLLGWIKLRIKKVSNGDGRKYSKQIIYIYRLFYDYLNEEERCEIERFFLKQSNFFTRLQYIFSSKLYRQGYFETVAFKTLYLFGGYNIDGIEI